MVHFLCTADLHIGRQSSGFDGETALDALTRIADLAISKSADALLIAGDLFDSSDAQFSTRKNVAEQLERLRVQSIPVVAVAGNHDYDALPTFARAYPGLIDLFGSNAWEEKEVAGVRVIGRSFGGATSKTLIDEFAGVGDARTTIGLLHADVDVKSVYNPTNLSSLAGRGVHAWVLGHVHAAREWANPLSVYPGSPQALDAGETGVHGVRWLTIESGSVALSGFHRISTIRFESIELTISPGETVDDVVANHLGSVRITDEMQSLRIRLGRLEGADPTIPDGIVWLGRDCYEIVDCFDVIDQVIDLDREAEQSDARGQAARLLLGLEGRGKQEWAKQANELVEIVSRDMTVNRLKLKLDKREEFEQLAIPANDESFLAVRRSLESVLAFRAGAGK